MTDTTTVLVTIGRNIGTDPLPDEDWAQFRLELASLSPTGWVVGASHGWGQWDGVREDNYSTTLNVPAGEVGNLRKAVARLARIWQQDGIGFVVLDDSTYVPAEELP